IVNLQSQPAPIVHALPRAQALPDHPAKLVKVPSLVGARYDIAAAKLRSLRFGVRRTSVSSTRPAGIVATVTPAPGSPQPGGKTITLGVSGGSLVAVPRLLGATR